MSFRNLSFFIILSLLFGGIFWFWPRANESVHEEVVITENSLAVEAKSVTENEVRFSLNEPISAELSLDNSCQFPIRYDLDGASYKLSFDAKVETGDLSRSLFVAADNLLSTYSKWLGSDQIKGVKLDIKVLSESEFHEYLLGQVADPKSYLGVYLPQENLAVVKFINEQQALATSVHEMVHAINFTIFGPLPRFINEGLAEYIARKAIVGSQQRFTLPKGLDKEKARAELLDFYSLMHSEQDWHTRNNSSLYLSGSAWAHFFFTSEKGVEAMQTIMRFKYANPCSELTPEQISSILAEIYPNFEQDFYYWFDEK